MDTERKKVLNSIRKLNNKEFTNKKKIKAKQRKLQKAKNKLLSLSNSENKKNSNDVRDTNSEKRDHNFSDFERNLLSNELILMKDSFKELKKENFTLRREIDQLKKDVAFQKTILTKMKNENDELMSQNRKDQKEVDQLKKSLCKQKAEKFDLEHNCSKDNKIKELNIQLRQQRAKNRHLNLELSTCKESFRRLEHEIKSTSNISEVVKIKFKKGKISSIPSKKKKEKNHLRKAKNTKGMG